MEDTKIKRTPFSDWDDSEFDVRLASENNKIPYSDFGFPSNISSPIKDDTFVLPEFEHEYFKEDLTTQSKHLIDNIEYFKRLSHFVSESEVLPEEGYVNTKSGNIILPFFHSSGRYIFSTAYGKENDCNCGIDCMTTYTDNNGFRYVGLNAEGKSLDLGPVMTPTLMGTYNQPQGMYVPIHNMAAIDRGIEFLQNLKKDFEENGEAYFEDVQHF